MKRFALIALVLTASVLPAAAQQQPEPKTLAEAKLTIAQQQAQIAELSLRVSELEAAFTSQLNQQRQGIAQQIQAAKQAVDDEKKTAAAPLAPGADESEHVTRQFLGRK